MGICPGESCDAAWSFRDGRKRHTEAEEPHFVKMVPVKSAQQMFEAVKEEAADADIVIMAAAVADYRPSEVYDQKVKKSDGEMSIALTAHRTF